jgi:hypothetical protein
LTLGEVTLLHLGVMRRSTKGDVEGCLERLSRGVGVPRGVLHDNAADLAGGARLLQKRHPPVRSLADGKHKAACLLKKRLHKDDRWKEFQKQLGRTKAEIQQTDLAFEEGPGGTEG